MLSTVRVLEALPRIAAMVCIVLGLAANRLAWGGLSASDVVVAVNGDSLNSRTLANHFISLRRIPAINVVVLKGIPNSEVLGVDEFRTKILRPLLTEIQRRKLLGHIQCISYSADFPSAIDISADLKGIPELPQIYTPKASINSLTYLYTQVMRNDPSYIDLYANYYARRELDNYFTNPGGRQTQAAWTEIQDLIASQKHAEAADSLEKLLEDYPHQFPLAYLAAAQAALAGEEERAIGLLKLAVSKGWNAGRFLANDERFASIRDEASYQVLELLLDDSIKELQPASGFDARTSWTPNGVPVLEPQFGNRFLLSTVLGISRGAGTSLPQAIEALRRSARADRTHPQGGFYFSLTGDVRTTTRQWGFIGAVDDLQQMGFEAEIIKTMLPENKPSVLGVQIGTPNFDWSTSNSQFAPGAIADNLTSLGGVMTGGAGQTNLSELIKAGAAGSSGAVAEPYAIQQKFPHPQLYVHYARGASLAEAFYLSVTGPYQLLIVGDPLCQPFSNAPDPQIDTRLRYLEENQPLKIEPKLDDPGYIDWLDSSENAAERNQPIAAAALRVLFDGVNPLTGMVEPQLNVKVDGQPPGYHEIAFQFYADDPLSQCSGAVVPVWIGQPDAVRLSFPSTQPKPNGPGPNASLQKEKTTVKIEAPQGKRVTLWHDWEQIAVASGNEAEFSVQLEMLGMGPVRLQPKVELADGTVVQGEPVWLEVLP